MLQPRTFPVGVGLLSSLFILFLIYSPKSRSLREYPSQVINSYTKIATSAADTGAAINETLGFERVFAVGLSERSDKRDALGLISSLTGFKIEWIEGMRGESVVDKALPFGVDRVKLWENNLGSWRGHMNAVRTIVEQGISTALIMEDDVDWDVRLKSQLQLIAHGTRTLQGSTSPSDSPYGDDWDLIWLGHCGEVFPEQLEENASKAPDSPGYISLATKYTIRGDPTVPPPSHARGFQNFTASPHTRWIHVTGGPICTFAYALSLAGARKVLFDLSVDHLVGPFDNALAGLCRWGREKERLGMRCYSVTPPVFVHHKSKGYISGDSDIQLVGGGEKGELREVGTTENIVWSARRNVREMIMGGDMHSQFD
ncbi:glycosyltransferase family 25 protein [Cadophora sp. DSE1049]|nr:glycosyltransferase family 25 protein [Cadophora sp. DSE1049]